MDQTAFDAAATNQTAVQITTVGSGSPAQLALPVTTDFASLANPLTPGFPTSFWYNRALTPTITLWPVPDTSTTYLMSYYVYTQPQDAVLRGGGQAAVPYWWLNAYTADLAHRLSRIYAPAFEAVRKVDRDEAWSIAATEDTEWVPMYIAPMVGGYWRR